MQGVGKGMGQGYKEVIYNRYKYDSKSSKVIKTCPQKPYFKGNVFCYTRLDGRFKSTWFIKKMP